MTSQFKQQLLEAKIKQRLRYIRVLMFFIITALFVLLAIFASRGTRINVQPDDAAQLATIHRHQGIAVVIGETLYSLSAQPAIAVYAEGFKSLIHVLSRKDFGQVITVTMAPLPAKLELSTTVDEKVKWLIDDELVAIAATLKHELPAGEYTLTVSHPYYQEESLSLSLARNDLLNQVISLTPIKGTLTVKTRPAGAHVHINESDQGISPQTLVLQGGRHAVTVTHDDYEPVHDIIEIARHHADVNREYHLEFKKATVNVVLTPVGGQLTLDDVPLSPTHTLRVSTGAQHTITYSKPGYFSQSRSFKLAAAGQTLDLNYSLKQEIGQVAVQSKPVADVFVNNKPVGTSPLKLSLAAVKQTITLRQAGFRSVTRQITPSAASPLTINVSLLNEKAARLREAKPFYRHHAGGTLKLFTPNETIRMGAERHERGQRANEFVRQVILNRAFYAGVHEVTLAEYRQFDNSITGQPQLPVTSIAWLDAARFCNWLGQQEGLQPVYRISNRKLTAINANSDGYRLLTEAEWEWLARKSAKPKQTRFVWSNSYVIPENAANVADESAIGSVALYVSKYNDGYPGIAPVKQFNREPSGLYDQGGNVSEWTHDSYSLLKPSGGKMFNNPLDRTISSVHVVKGANWRSGSVTELRASFREGIAESRDDLGFRIGRSVYGGH
ncbi:MAG: SUMF1/EgtB/PvdO family nonheme iron enzyme [Gammaproteobacteria bacterium]|nr:SUMF1/EgtB/PvdO family nonheme iron enzyme [Gammaproteobacteria bacterium]